MPGDRLFCPLVIFYRSNDELHFVGFAEMLNIFPTVARFFATAGRLQIHDAPHARVNFRNIVRATGLDQDDQPSVAQLFHQNERIGLQQWFASGEFNQRQPKPRRDDPRMARKPKNLLVHIAQCHLASFGKGVGCIAIRTAQVAGRQPYKNARQPRKGALALQAEINFIDDQRFGHGARMHSESKEAKSVC